MTKPVVLPVRDLLGRISDPLGEAGLNQVILEINEIAVKQRMAPPFQFGVLETSQDGEQPCLIVDGKFMAVLRQVLGL